MNVDELWRALSSTEELPAEAIRASLDRWDEVSPRYLAKLRAVAGGAQLDEADFDALFVVLYLCAEKRDERAYEPLCRIMAAPAEDLEGVEGWLDAPLSNILISVFDGDCEPLKALALSQQAEPFMRAQGLHALSYVIRARAALSDDDGRRFFAEFGKQLDFPDDGVGEAWGIMVAALGYGDLKAEVARALSKRFIGPQAYDIKAFHADLTKVGADPSGLVIFQELKLGPLESALDALSELFWGGGADFGEDSEEDLGSEKGLGSEKDLGEEFDEDSVQDLDLDAEPGALPKPLLGEPVRNPYRDVGRNDPCPCGSGKKFKKCCLPELDAR